MLQIMDDVPAGILALRGVGKVSNRDHETVLLPEIAKAARSGSVRLLYELGSDFDGFTGDGVWEDGRRGAAFMPSLDACAIVTDHQWLREAVRMMRFTMASPVHLFANAERDRAVAWLRTVPIEGALKYRILDDLGVVVVDVHNRLRAADFDRLSSVVDPWIAAHDGLQGVVIHAHHFPGWENVSSLLRHIRFVRDHQGKVKRAALSVDSQVAQAMAKVAERWLRPELRAFGYDSLDQAVTWASGSREREATLEHARA
jgi:hypothetical protein